MLTPWSEFRILEMHNKNVIAFLGVFLSITGWFLWNLGLSGVWDATFRIYHIRRAFLDNFGPTLNFWAVCLVALGACIVLELVVNALRRVYLANDVDLLQRAEKQEEREAKRARKGAKRRRGLSVRRAEEALDDVDLASPDELEESTIVDDTKSVNGARGTHVGVVTTTATTRDPAHLGPGSARPSLQLSRLSRDEVARRASAAAVPEVEEGGGTGLGDDGTDPFESRYGPMHKTRRR